MTRPFKSFGLRLARVLAQPLVAIIVGLIIGAAVILVAGESPWPTYVQMFEKSFFSAYYLMQTLTRAVPVTVCAIAIITAWRAGYINLGVEGQMIAGSFVGTAIAIYSPLPTPLTVFLAVLCGMATGAILAVFSAFIYDRFNVSIVISTLMMNYIADFICSYFITFPLRDPASDLAIQTEEIPEIMRLPRLIEGNTMNLGLIITIGLVILFALVNSKTSFGYESKMTGLNPVFARYGGIKQRRVMYMTMALSGGLAAAAGMLEIYGVKYRFAEAMFTSTGYAWTGLMSALISSLHPVGALFTSIFLSGLQVGGQAIQRTLKIPLQVATVIQASITLFVSIRLIIQFKTAKKNKTPRRENEGQVKPDGR
jgi:simple sugar transport system permease protein